MKYLTLMIVLLIQCVVGKPKPVIDLGWSPSIVKIPTPIDVPRLIPYPPFVPYPVYIFVYTSEIPDTTDTTAENDDISGNNTIFVTEDDSPTEINTDTEGDSPTELNTDTEGDSDNQEVDTEGQIFEIVPY